MSYILQRDSSLRSSSTEGWKQLFRAYKGLTRHLPQNNSVKPALWNGLKTKLGY